MKASAALAAWVGLAGSVLVLAATPSAQGLSANETYRVQGMLRHAYEVVKKEYYDPTFHGVDLEARFREYEGKMKAVDSLNAGVMMVAAFLDGLKDSHTYFQPPPRPYRVDYGYDIRIIGDDAYITGVHAGTDAVSKVRPGDRVLSVPVTAASGSVAVTTVCTTCVIE